MARPSALTDEISKQICDSLKLGATKKASAESAGIDYATFNNWMKRGAVEKRGKFVQFFKAVGHAEAFCFRNMAATIAKAAADGDWRAAETFLKRRDPENWGDRSKLDLTVSESDVTAAIERELARLAGISQDQNVGTATGNESARADQVA